MSEGKGRLAGLWSTEDGQRLVTLDRARKCAALTKPWVLPPLNQSPDQKLPENYQSVGSRGVTNLSGKMVMALFPPDEPWFNLVLSPDILYDKSIPDAAIQEAQDALFMQELMIQATLESADLVTSRRPVRHAGFRSAKRAAMDQLLVTGDTLEQLTDDYRLILYRRDQYVTRRDTCGDVLYHVIKESIDPLSLGEGMLSKAGLNTEDFKKKPVSERMTDLYTEVAWQPLAKKWKICQELNGQEINESEETVTQFFSTPAELSPGEHYGRGFVEMNLGDLTSMDELEKRLLQFAELCSKFHPCVDDSSNVRDEDLERPSGTILRGVRVIAGQVQDVGWLKVEKYPDFKVVFDTAERKRKDLGAAMLIESEVTPRGDRVTAFQASRVARELEGTLGGFYAPIADEQQQPLLKRCIHQLQRDKVLPILPKDTYRTVSLTGLAALSREAKGGRVMSYAAAAAQLGPTALAKVDMGVLMDVLARYQSISERGLVKSNAQTAAEQQAMIAANTKMAAGEKAVDVAGNVAQAAMTPQGT